MKFADDLSAILSNVDDKWQEEHALDYIYENIDDMLWAGDEAKSWPEIDEILSHFVSTINDWPICIILGLLTSSSPVMSELKNYGVLFTTAESEWKRLGVYEEGLLRGLEL